MADIELVIKIDEENYKWVCDHVNMGHDLFKMIANGTPLPKGHGRLIDADAFIKNEECCGYIEDMDIDVFNAITPTIIEADKGDKE